MISKSNNNSYHDATSASFNVFFFPKKNRTLMPLSISIETVMRNSEMLKFIPDHLKSKKMCKHAVKKLPSVIRYVAESLFLTAAKIKKYVLRQLMITLMH